MNVALISRETPVLQVFGRNSNIGYIEKGFANFTDTLKLIYQ